MAEAQMIEAHGAADVELVACDLCGSPEASPFMSTHDRAWPIHNNEPQAPEPPRIWSTVRCTACGLIYLSPRPTTAVLANYYPSKYYAYESINGLPPPNRWNRLAKRLLRRNRAVYEFALRTPLRDRLTDRLFADAGWMKPGRVFDIGFGTATDLDNLAALGWTTFGIDFAEPMVRQAASRGHRVWLGDVTEVDIPERNMDAVLMSHILEHTPSPRRTLEAVRRLLRPGGVLIVEVPNIGTLWTTVFGERSSSVDLPRHFYHFTGQTLEQMLIAAGFRVRVLKTKANPRFIVRSMRLSMRAAEPRQALRRDGTPLRDLDESPALLAALQPFCQQLEQLDQGNNLVAVAEPA